MLLTGQLSVETKTTLTSCYFELFFAEWRIGGYFAYWDNASPHAVTINQPYRLYLIQPLLLHSLYAIPIDNGLILKAIPLDEVTSRIETVCETTSGADFITVIDGSTSIGDNNFQLLRNFLASTAASFPESSRFAAVEFSGHPTLLWGFDAFTRREEAVEAYRTMKYIRGTTRIALALEFTLENVLFENNRPEYPDLMVVITDGRSSDMPDDIAREIRSKGVTIVAMGITRSVDPQQLLAIAGDESKIIYVENFEQLDDTARSALLGKNQICREVEIFDEPVNQERGEPTIQVKCNPDSIHVSSETRNPFDGHVYVKNQFLNPNCVKPGDGVTAFAELEIPFDQCNTVRRRSLEPRGIFVETHVVFTFHPKFQTKVDRSFKVKCFYMEADKTVATEIEVSPLTEVAVTQVFPMPTCQYTIHRDSIDGPEVKFAVVGEKLFHKWTCDDSQSERLFKMLVYNCFVTDGQGNIIELLDADGCAIDKHLLSDLEYLDDRMVAHVEAHAFKYPDLSGQYFQCQISLCVDEEGGCTRTPPICGAARLSTTTTTSITTIPGRRGLLGRGRNQRKKRNISLKVTSTNDNYDKYDFRSASYHNYDVISETLEVADLDTFSQPQSDWENSTTYVNPIVTNHGNLWQNYDCRREWTLVKSGIIGVSTICTIVSTVTVFLLRRWD